MGRGEARREATPVDTARLDEARSIRLVPAPADAPAQVPLEPLSQPRAGGQRPRWWRDQLRRRMLALADTVVAGGIGLGVLVATGDPIVWSLVAVPIGLVAAKLLGLYDADHKAIRHQTIDELQSIGVWAGIVTVGTMLTTPETPGGGEFAGIVAAGFLAGALARGLARFAWRSVTPPERTLVIGAGRTAEAIRRKVALFDDMHLELVSDVTPTVVSSPDGADPLAGIMSDVDRVVVAWNEADPNLVERLVELCRRHQTKLSVVSPFRGRARPAERVSSIADVPVLEYNTWDIPRSTVVLKRAFDIVVAGVGLTVLAPLFLLVAVAIKLDDGGPVFFRQRRAGKGGRPFEMLKFRSMSCDAEERLRALVALEQLKDPMFKLRDDPRVTRVGRFLRRFSLDELPQLWNALKGEMSLVGPRPEELVLVDRYRPEHRFKLAVKPGITGPMQVFGRGELSFAERMAVEIDYVENVSLTRDLKLLAETLPALARGKGAF